MIVWRAPDCENVAAPAAAAALLERAIAAAPDNPALRVKSADLAFDRYDFAAAEAALRRALRLDPAAAPVRRRLARCLNDLRRHDEALEIVARLEGPEFERASALAALGREAEAERECRAVLAAEPHNRPASRQLCRLLRRSGRTADLMRLCEELAARGVRHGQLLHAWGTALALNGRETEARAILFDRARVAETELPCPPGFATIDAFNAALAEEILANANRLSDFPREDEANRGSSRVHALFAGRRPELIRLLLNAIQDAVSAWAPSGDEAGDPWLEARPAAAHLKAWGLIQRGGDYEEWHLHPGGWLSGVYYVRVPAEVSAEGDGPGCIEFGPPGTLQRAMPDYLPVWRHRPREGGLLLAPSHYPHRTIPSGADDNRISIAFDVVPHT